MNNIFTVTNIEENGIIHFDFNGDDIKETYEVSIIDNNTGLTVHKSNMGLRKETNWWISTGESNAKRLRNITLSIMYGDLQYSQNKLNYLIWGTTYSQLLLRFFMIKYMRGILLDLTSMTRLLMSERITEYSRYTHKCLIHLTFMR